MEETQEKKGKGGRKPGKPRNAKERHLVAAGQVFRRCLEHSQGKIEMTATQLKAADIVLSRTMPTLSAVEQTIVNDQDAKPLEQIHQELIALVKANPDLLVILNEACKEDKLTEDRKVVSIR